MGPYFFIDSIPYVEVCLLRTQPIVYDENTMNFFLVLNINNFIIFNLKTVVL